MLRNLGGCEEEAKRINDAKEALENAVRELKGLRWDHLCAIEDDKRHELTTHQQSVIECYAKLKRALLEVYKELFHAIKEM
jgi:hypothetical protein